MKRFAIENIQLKVKTYTDAISVKFDNRRVTVVELPDGYGFEFRMIDKDSKPHAHCEHIHGRMALTRVKLSKEASEVLLISLAQQMGFEIIKPVKE